MATSKKLSRADVYKQIDAFRGIVKRNPGDQLSAEQWVESKRVDLASVAGKFQRPATLAGKSAG